MVDASFYLVLAAISAPTAVLVALFRSSGFWEWLKRRQLLSEKRRVGRIELELEKINRMFSKRLPPELRDEWGHDSMRWVRRWSRELDRIFGVRGLTIRAEEDDQE